VGNWDGFLGGNYSKFVVSFFEGNNARTAWMWSVRCGVVGTRKEGGWRKGVDESGVIIVVCGKRRAHIEEH